MVGYGFRVGVLVGGVDFAVGAAANGSGALLLRGAVSVLYLDKLRVGGNFAVDVGVYLGVEARRVKALVALHVGKQADVLNPLRRGQVTQAPAGGFSVGSSLSNGASARNR